MNRPGFCLEVGKIRFLKKKKKKAFLAGMD